jgi:anti-sigma B factor antagonist
MEIQTRKQDDCWVVAVKGSADVAAVDELREVLTGLVEADPARVICDLSQTDFVCSDALGVFITVHLRAGKGGGFLRLAALQERLQKLLETTRLNRLFAIFPDVPGAVKA